MNITEKQLIEIISEEIDRMVENDEIDENVLDRLKATAAGATATLNPFASQGDAALKKAASTMNSYSNHLLKLQQKLDLDAQKLGIADIDDIKQVSNTIKQTQQKVQDVAKTAPKSEKFKAAVQRAIADRSGGQGGQQQAAPAPGQQQAAPRLVNNKLLLLRPLVNNKLLPLLLRPLANNKPRPHQQLLP